MTFLTIFHPSTSG